jgi:hypothetical protein
MCTLLHCHSMYVSRERRHSGNWGKSSYVRTDSQLVSPHEVSLRKGSKASLQLQLLPAEAVTPHFGKEIARVQECKSFSLENNQKR